MPRPAAKALAKMGETRAIPIILSKLKTEHDPEYFKALEQLRWQPTCDEAGACYWIYKGKLDKCVEIGQKALHPLVRELERWHNYCSKEAIPIYETIGKVGDSQAVYPLIPAIKATYDYRGGDRAEMAEIRKVIFDALLSIGSPVIEPCGSVYLDSHYYLPKIRPK